MRMVRDTLTGSRIREKRVAAGLKQADLARQAGISASYLNLIEHNRRRIGGKLLLDIAHVLQVEPALLTEGAGAALISSLREAASDSASPAELDRVDEFAGRFPGWAQLLADAQGRIAALERTVESLTDRMTHDPHLATSLHEMLTTETAIHSAASILAEPDGIDREWQARFHRNIHEDSARLAETSRGLVSYLDTADASATVSGNPQEELYALQDRLGYHVPQLEQGADVEAVLPQLAQGMSAVGRDLLAQWLHIYMCDARVLPQVQLKDAVADLGCDPTSLAQRLGLDPDVIMRRLAALPQELLPEPVGLAICDASGVLRYRKPLPDFPMPRFGAACPLWPLYQALNRPMVMLSRPVAQPGRETLLVDALATPATGIAVNDDTRFHAHMLVRRQPEFAAAPSPRPVGVDCRICPRSRCDARAEPTILSAPNS
jgi:predicted transcriptional regulator/DNA-binding XRE family transcriptional regulator